MRDASCLLSKPLLVLLLLFFMLFKIRPLALRGVEGGRGGALLISIAHSFRKMDVCHYFELLTLRDVFAWMPIFLKQMKGLKLS